MIRLVARRFGKPIGVAQEEMLEFLKRGADPVRPLPTVAFKDRHVLRVGCVRMASSVRQAGSNVMKRSA